MSFYTTLTASLESATLSSIETLNDYWDGTPIGYGETARKRLLCGNRYSTVIIYRNEQGMYENPPHYDAGIAN